MNKAKLLAYLTRLIASEQKRHREATDDESLVWLHGRVEIVKAIKAWVEVAKEDEEDDKVYCPECGTPLEEKLRLEGDKGNATCPSCEVEYCVDNGKVWLA